MNRLSAFLVVLALFFAAPAWAAIGTPLTRTGADNSSGTTITLTVSGSDVAAGTLMVFTVLSNNSRALNTVADSVGGNTYTVYCTTSTTYRHCMAWGLATNALPIGSVITLSYSANCSKLVVWQTVTGINQVTPLALAGTGAIGTDATPTATITPPTSAEQILFGSDGVVLGVADTLTQDVTFSNAATRVSSNNRSAMSSRVVSSTVPVTKVDANTVSGVPQNREWMARILSFNGDGTAPPTNARKGLMTLGVGGQ